MNYIKYSSGAKIDENNNLVEVKFPAHWEICFNCEGNGSHTNRSIDGNGLTYEDINNFGDDFLSDYLSGVYDVGCKVCNGSGKLLFPDPIEESDELYDSYKDWLSDFNWNNNSDIESFY